MTQPLTDEQLLAVESRRMSATRLVLQAYAKEVGTTIAYLELVWKGHEHKPGMDACRFSQSLVLEALEEVDRMERGCGAEEGECTDPCHIGVR